MTQRGTPRFPGISALVLAGGRSTRFGSDKAAFQLGGRPLLAALVDALTPLFSEVLVVSKSAERYAPLVAASGARHVTDELSTHNPLTGIVSGVAAARNPVVFACACDMPFAADVRAIEVLQEALGDAAAVAFTRAGIPEPLLALYRRDACLPVARLRLAAGDGPRRVLEEVGARLLSFEECFPEGAERSPLFDVDTPDDAARAVELLRG